MKRLLIFLLFASPVLAQHNVARADFDLYGYFGGGQTNTFCAANLACTVTGVWTFSTSPVFSGGISGSSKWVDVIGGTPDSLSNVNTVLNTKLYSLNPLTLPQATYFNQIDISGSHAGAPLSFGADFGEFIQFRVHDTTSSSSWPNFWEGDASEFEAEAYGTMTGGSLPNYRLCAVCGQTFVDDKGTDSIVIPFASDFISRGPFRSTVATSRPGSITVTNGNTAISGSGTNFAAGDVGKLLWWDGNGANGSNALSGCTITSVTNATTAACVSGWTGITTTTNWWQVTAVGATGPAGSTSSLTNAYSATFTQPVVATSENLAVRLGQVAGHPEESVQIALDNQAIHQWKFGLFNNANTQSNDFVVQNIIASANPTFLRFRIPGNDGASQRGDIYLSASGTNGTLNFNQVPSTFAGEGAAVNVGTGGACFGAGGSGAAMAALPCALTGVLRIPFGTFLKSCNVTAGSPCNGDIPLIGTNGTNSEQIGDPAAVNLMILSAATAIQHNAPITLSTGHVFIAVTAPTIAAAGCGGGAASIVVNNGTAAFKVNVGTTPGSACTITFPAATTGWNVTCNDITTQSTSVFVQKQTGAESTTSVVITNFNDVAVATAFVASDILKCTASAD